MDLFEAAAQRLERDQQTARGRRRTGGAVSAKAKREADYRKKQQQHQKELRERQQMLRDFQEKYYHACERALGVKPLPSSSGSTSLELTPTSIWGDGDKIALPPSVLEYLTTDSLHNNSMTSSPWMFRIGILNHKNGYKFPQSVLLQTLKPTDDDDDSHSEEEEEHETKEAYLDELHHKYISYTHGTVVEFTQEEGHVGLPPSIAKALLLNNANENETNNIPVTRTQDPSAPTSTTDNMQLDDNNIEKTPGHVAYGAFDIPDCPVEITLLRLPKGTACTLTPTPAAIENGFYNLRSIKLVLEQSLIRTRATLSVGDEISSWHRGVQYELTVTKVVPSTFQAITCINTDIEVEFGAVDGDNMDKDNDVGQTLGSSSAPPQSTTTTTMPPSSATTVQQQQLLPEPPADQTDNVCTILIRSDQQQQSSSRRRFDIAKATIQDLFEFAASTTSVAPFRLVTRFPRKVYECNGTMTLKQAGMQPGQELLMVERM